MLLWGNKLRNLLYLLFNNTYECSLKVVYIGETDSLLTKNCAYEYIRSYTIEQVTYYVVNSDKFRLVARKKESFISVGEWREIQKCIIKNA